MLSVYADIQSSEVTVEAKPGKVKPEQLVEVVNRTSDGEHSFRAKLKRKESKE